MNEVERFLAAHPPFDGLPAEVLEGVAGSVQVEFFPVGAVIMQEQGSPSDHLYVIRSGSVEMVQAGQVVDVLDEGEMFGHPSVLSRRSPVMTVRAEEDTLCYLLPGALAQRVFGSESGLAFLAASLRRRLDRAIQIRTARAADPRLVTVGSLIARPPLECRPEDPVRRAAEIMAKERCSSVLVRSPEGYGIVTDRDLRTKVVARGLSPDQPVAKIMTSPVRTIPAESMVDDAILQMLDAGIHHLPVVDPSGNAIGVLTDTDVLGLERRRPFVLRTRIERAAKPEEVAELGRSLPEATATLVRAGVDAVDIGHIVALIVDALTVRLIDLAIAELGPEPAPWAWLALGSEARREQALRTDQDHALAYADGAEEHDDYFRALGERVVEGLEACGIPRCPAGVVASEERWRRPRSGWVRTFDEWMTAREVEPVMLTTIGFDHRVIFGSLEVERVLEETIRSARDRRPFLRRLARTALGFRPPIGFRGDIVVLKEGEHAGSLDLKHRGVLPLIDLARLFALESGVAVPGTLRRLAAAETAGTIDAETHRALEEAFRVILDARAQHQAKQVERGTEPDNFIDPSELGPIARARLKDAFRAIAHVQRDVAKRFSISRLS